MAGGHFIHFLDHPFLPANAAPDVPKIIASGISDDGPMDPQSPHVTAPDGIATLLYRMHRETWLNRFLDVEGTHEFSLVMKEDPWQDIYVRRHGRSVEIGFVGDYAGFSIPAPGVRFNVEPSGEWKPISTSDLGAAWGGTQMWIRGQSQAFAKAIWYMSRWSQGIVQEIHWTGMTDAEEEEARKKED